MPAAAGRRPETWDQRILFAVCMVILAVAAAAGSAGAVVPYQSYTYDMWGEAIPAPLPYVPARAVDGRSLGIGDFKAPQDLFVDARGLLYILDTGNNRIVVVDREMRLLRVISRFDINGREDGFKGPRGLFVTAEGRLYVADTDNGRIVELTVDGQFLREIGAPGPEHATTFAAGFVYRPVKVGVDHAGRIFVVARDQYDGLMEFNVDGEFRGFVGAPRVTPTLADVLWSRIATDAQRERQALFLPTEFSALDVDDDGFIFVTKQGAANNQAIKKLNPAGRDVLIRKGPSATPGDVWNYEPNVTVTGPSAFADVVARDHGIYSALDRNRGRVFTYDENGRLLYVFGGRGGQWGNFRGPVALDVLPGNAIVVLDEIKNRAIVFEPTRYAALIHAAIALYDAGYYDESERMWLGVLQHNANYELAYIGVGRARYRQDDFYSAMVNFRLANDREGYSEAFRMYRRLLIEQYFGAAMTSLVVGLMLLWGVRSARRRRLGNVSSPRVNASAPFDLATDANASSLWLALRGGLKYALYVMVHPIRGFWDLKHENRGNAASATAILAAVILTVIAVRQYTGFIFNARKIQDLNVIVEALSILVPFALWTVVNWAITTLMDGKGSIKDVYIASAYALTPIVVIYVPLTLVSHVLVQEEGTLYFLIFALGLIWSMTLLFTGTMMVHDYNVSTTLLSVVCILAGMGFMLFIGMLSYEIIGSATGFLTAIYREIAFRL